MKLLANENFPVKSFKILKAAGYDITHINFENPSVEDEEVVLMAISQNRIIITFDSDYGALVFQKRHEAARGNLFAIQRFSCRLPGCVSNEFLQGCDLPA